MKIKKLIQKFRHFFAIAAIVLCAVVCMAWVGYDTVKDSVGLGYRQIVNDDYAVLTEAIGTEGITQPISVKANTDFYGVNLNMHTYNRVVFGTIFVELMDTQGNVLAVAQDDMTNIKDNTFMRFTWGEENFKADEDREYILRVYTNPQTDEDRVAMWKSEATVEGYKPMTENGTETQGTLALQYIVKYVTGAIWDYYILLCALMLILLVGAYLLIFVRKAKVTAVFVFAAFVLGVIFALCTPVKGAPDEYVHITSAYSTSNSLFGYKYGGYYEGDMLMRESDAGDWVNPVNYNAFELHDYWENFEKNAEKNENLVLVKANKANVFPPLYWAQALGIHIARILGLSFSMLVFLGRMGNLALYIMFCGFAIKRMPFYKTVMAAVALTPIPMQLAASFSYDTLVIGLCFLFTAVVFDLAYSKEGVKKNDIILLAVLAAFIAPSKTIYVLIVALIFIIPLEKFGSTKKAVVSFGIIVVAAAGMWLCYNQSVVEMIIPDIPDKVVDVEEVTQKRETKDEYFNEIGADTVTFESQSDAIDEAAKQEIEGTGITAGGDSLEYFTFGYILTHIPQTVKLVVNTLQENTELYIRQIFGGIFGESIVSPVKLNWIYVFAVMAIVFATTLLQQEEKLQYKGIRKWWCLAVALGVVALACAAGVMWTPVNYTTAFGIQGRYALPVLPLVVMFLANDNITLKKKLDGPLLFALCAVNVLMLLDGLTIMLANTTVYY